MASLADIRARLSAQENKSQGNSTFQGDNAIFAHWNIKEDETATVRFLPDGDGSNPYFWVERQMINLPFNGIKGGDSKPVTVKVPCIEMWSDMGTCPILAEVRTWFKDKSLEDMGRKYWKKRSYLFQGFVHQNPLDEEAPENPIRRFIISPQIFNIIKASLMDPELEDLPTDYNNGLDFKIAKGSKGGYADYSTSNWARKESALTADELEAIETNGLYDLKNFLPNKPGEVELKVMFEMFEASVDGKAYDPEKWGQYFTPPGMQKTGGVSDSSAAPAPKAEPKTESAPAPNAEDDTPPFDVDETATKVEEPAKEGGASKAEDILAMIRSRQS